MRPSETPEYRKKYRELNKEKLRLQAKKHRDTRQSNGKSYTYQKSYKSSHPEVVRKSNYKYHYGITIDDYNKLFVSQNGKCAICEIHQSELKKRLSVDHCHTTNRIRGLLCNRCNFAIGLLEDDLSLFDKAKEYLKNEI